MTNEIAISTKTNLVIDPEQSEFTSSQVAILRQLGIEDATQGDLDLFFHQCKRTGLDPFAKQIYMIGRRTKIKEWNPQTRKQDEKWVMKWTIQTGIDGYRLNGRRAADRLGEKVQIEGPFWQGADGGGWTDVWLDPRNPPAAAKFTIIRDGEAFTGIAMYSEYVQTYTADGKQVPNSMWAKMPANQIAKCAEAAAWRRAYPDDFSGLILEDTAQPQVIDEVGQPVRASAERVQGPKRGTAGLAEKLGIQTAPAPEPAAGPPADPTPEVATPDELKALTEALRAADITDVAEIKAFLSGRIGRDLGTMKELTSLEVAAVLDFIANGEPA
jgi:phage recombination protein Bet